MKIWKPIALCTVAGAVVAALALRSAPAEAGGVCHGQPNMQAALDGLRAARASLDKAEHNKGGWRDRAEAAADNAIKETVAGCAVADTH